MNLQILSEKFSAGISRAGFDKGQVVVEVTLGKVVEVLKFLKEDPEFKMNMLMDVIGVDHLGQDPRFEVVYILYSVTKKQRIRLHLKVKENEEVQTAIPLYSSADWAEREIWDMYGIKFKDHPNLKRILMFEGFEGHPLRKDYPVNKRQPIPEIEEILE